MEASLMLGGQQRGQRQHGTQERVQQSLGCCQATLGMIVQHAHNEISPLGAQPSFNQLLVQGTERIQPAGHWGWFESYGTSMKGWRWFCSLRDGTMQLPTAGCSGGLSCLPCMLVHTGQKYSTIGHQWHLTSRAQAKQGRDDSGHLKLKGKTGD